MVGWPCVPGCTFHITAWNQSQDYSVAVGMACFIWHCAHQQYSWQALGVCGFTPIHRHATLCVSHSFHPVPLCCAAPRADGQDSPLGSDLAPLEHVDYNSKELSLYEVQTALLPPFHVVPFLSKAINFTCYYALPKICTVGNFTSILLYSLTVLALYTF